MKLLTVSDSSFSPSKNYPSYIASLFAGVTGRSSRARGRRKAQTSTYLTVGDPMQLTAIRSFQQCALSARAWRATTEEDRQADSPESSWSSYAAGLFEELWAAFPKKVASSINPENAPAASAEAILSFPKFATPGNRVAAYLHNLEEPPPKPPKPDEIREGHTSAWRKRPTVTRVSEEVDEEGAASTGYSF